MSQGTRPSRKTVSEIDAQIEALLDRRKEAELRASRRIVDAFNTSGLTDLKLNDDDLMRVLREAAARCRATTPASATVSDKSTRTADRGSESRETLRAG